MLSSGALAIHPGPGAGIRLVRSRFCRAAERGFLSWFWVGTLLGPEGTAAGLGLLTGQVPVITDVVAGFGFCPFLENCTVDASISCFCDIQKQCVILLCQVFKGTRWMPWYQEPMKDVGACDKPRGVGSQTVIRGCPNGETWRPSWAVASA
jgi:hypothetical protein